MPYATGDREDTSPLFDRVFRSQTASIGHEAYKGLLTRLTTLTPTDNGLTVSEIGNALCTPSNPAGLRSLGLRAYLSEYWDKEATAFHDGWNDRFERMFLGEDVCVVDDLEQQIKNRGPESAFDFLYEIGCGGGQVLQYLHDRFPQFQTLTGIDLGEDQIQKNRTTYSQNRLDFVAGDACKWIPENAKPNSVILTNGGVFEYFLQSELETLFSHAARSLSPVAVCITETLATDHDLESETDSLVYGREMAFSHNYSHLLKSAGFKIISCSERAGDPIDGGGRWIRLLAIAE